MKALVAHLNAELFPVDPPDNQPGSPPTQLQDTEEDDEFSQAFNQSEQGVLVALIVPLHY